MCNVTFHLYNCGDRAWHSTCGPVFCRNTRKHWIICPDLRVSYAKGVIPGVCEACMLQGKVSTGESGRVDLDALAEKIDGALDDMRANWVEVEGGRERGWGREDKECEGKGKEKEGGDGEKGEAEETGEKDNGKGEMVMVVGEVAADESEKGEKDVKKEAGAKRPQGWSVRTIRGWTGYICD